MLYPCGLPGGLKYPRTQLRNMNRYHTLIPTKMLWTNLVRKRYFMQKYDCFTLSKYSKIRIALYTNLKHTKEIQYVGSLYTWININNKLFFILYFISLYHYFLKPFCGGKWIYPLKMLLLLTVESGFTHQQKKTVLMLQEVDTPSVISEHHVNPCRPSINYIFW